MLRGLSFFAASALVALAFSPHALATSHDDDEEDDSKTDRLVALHAARNESLRMFHENRTAAIDEYKAAFNATKASFIENKTRVLAACGALDEDGEEEDELDNATQECVREGLKPLIDAARDAHHAQKQAALARLLQAREDAKEAFRAARDAYGPHGSG